MSTQTESRTFADDHGDALAIGDRVVKTAIDHGAPAWAHKGTIVGFGRTRVLIEWDGVSYDRNLDARFAFHKPHGVNATTVRKIGA